MSGDAEVGRRTLRSARELAHLATSLASEAANLTRTLENLGVMHASIAASQAGIEAAQCAFAIDALALGPAGAEPDAATLHDVFLKTESCLDAAETALAAARGALEAAATGLRHGDAGASTE